MAKKKADSGESSAVSIDSLPKMVRDKIGAMRRSVVALAGDYKIVREKVSEIAPKIVALWVEAQTALTTASLAAGGNAVALTRADFARMFDDTVPEHAGTAANPGYRQHAVYYTIEYAFRVNKAKTTTRKKKGVFNPVGPAGIIPRLLKTILSVVSDPVVLWDVIAREFSLENKSRKTLMKRVEDVEPLIDLTAIIKRPITLAGAPVIHMTAPLAEGQEPAKPESNVRAMRGALGALAAPGKRVAVGGGGRMRRTG